MTVPPGTIGEIVSLRSRYAKEYATLTPGRRIAVITPSPQHFKHKTTGEWTNRADLLQQISASEWESLDEQVQFNVSQANALQIKYAGFTATLKPVGLYMVDTSSPNNRRREIAAAALGVPTFINTGKWPRFQWIDIIPGVDFEIQVRDKSFKTQTTIKQDLGLPDPAGLGWNPATTLVIVGFNWIGSPRPLTELESGNTVSGNYFGTVDLCLRDPQGNPILLFPAGVATTPWLDTYRRTEPVRYVRTNQINLGVAIAYRTTALNHYPIVIDPTATIDITATANDGYISYDYDLPGWNYATSTYGDTNGHSWSDDGKGTTTEIDYRAYFRFDLSAYSGYTANAGCKLRCYPYNMTGATPTFTPKLYTTDWGTLTDADWGQAGNDQGTGTATAATWTEFALTAADIEAKFGGVASFEIRSDVEGDSNHTVHRLVAWEDIDWVSASNEAEVYLDYSTGGTTLYPGAASLTVTAQTPTVTATADVTVTPGSASLTATAQTPSVTVTQLLYPGAASLTVTAQTPTVDVTGDVPLYPGAATLNLSAQTPTVVANITQYPGAASLSLSAQTPTVDVSASQTLYPGSTTATVTAQTPTVSVGTDVTLEPSTASLALTAQTPTVVANITQYPGAASLTVTAQQPTVTATEDVALYPGGATVSLSAQTPTATQTTNYTGEPGTATLVLTAYAVTVQTPPGSGWLTHIQPPSPRWGGPGAPAPRSSSLQPPSGRIAGLPPLGVHSR